MADYFAASCSFAIFFLHLVLATGDTETSNNEDPIKETILKNAPWNVKLLLLKNLDPVGGSGPKIRPYGQNRRVGIQALLQRRDAEPSAPHDEDESSMRLKLFRLMYETVRDSDIKVKKAEVIQNHYNSSPLFEIGYLMGELQDKVNVVSDFSDTLKRYYDLWKPVEHINAYEQIANYGIQINHIVELIKSAGKNYSPL